MSLLFSYRAGLGGIEWIVRMDFMIFLNHLYSENTFNILQQKLEAIHTGNTVGNSLREFK